MTIVDRLVFLSVSNLQPVQGGTPGRDVTAGRATGALLVVVAGLVFAASFLPLASLDTSTDHLQLRAWTWDVGGGHGRPRMLGIAFVMCCLVAGVAGLLLIVRSSARNTGVRWLVGFGSGIAVGVTSTVVVEMVSNSIRSDEALHFQYGVGFWLSLVAMLLSLGAMVIGMVGIERSAPRSVAAGSVQSQLVPVSGRGSDGVTGAFLVLAASAAIGGATLLEVKLPGTTLPVWLFGLVLGGLFAIGVAVLLFVGSGTRGKLVRMCGSLAAGMVFGMTFTMAVDTNFGSYGFAIGGLRLGEWLLTMAVPLSVGATVASLVSNLATSRIPATARAPYQPVFPPSQAPNYPPPNYPAPQGFPAQPQRMARVYDGRGADGRPTVDRPALNPNTRTAVLAYLESAPVVLSARSLDEDEFAPGQRDVPLNFRTDGVWVWSGAVPHYLHKHGLPPEPELVRHIVARGFQVQAVDEATKERAVRMVTGG